MTRTLLKYETFIKLFQNFSGVTPPDLTLCCDRGGPEKDSCPREPRTPATPLRATPRQERRSGEKSVREICCHYTFDSK